MLEMEGIDDRGFWIGGWMEGVWDWYHLENAIVVIGERFVLII